MGILCGCEKNRLYSLGSNSFNDHKALIQLFQNPKTKIPLWIERMTLRLQAYYFDLKFTKGEFNISDYTSRHPVDKIAQKNNCEEYLNIVVTRATPKAISIEEIKPKTKSDRLMQNLIRFNHCHKIKEPEFQNDDITLLKRYEWMKNELTVSEKNDLILKDNCIILPNTLQSVAVQFKEHLGIVKTKSLLRTKVYFPNIDKMVENLIKDCISCQAIGKQNKPAKLNIMPVPERICQEINIDYLGPLPNGKYILVTIDQRSRHPEVVLVSSSSADQLLLSLDRILSSYGLPEVIITDNGPPFNSQAVKDYMLSHAIKHRRITPSWPQANAEAERFMQSLKEILKAAYIEKVEWRRAVYEFLSQYRHTPHCTTKIFPSEMMFNRKVRHIIPDQFHQSK